MSDVGTTIRPTTHPVDYQWQTSQPYLFVVLLVVIVIVCCLAAIYFHYRSFNRQNNNESRELESSGVRRVEIDLFSISRYSSDNYTDEIDSMCSICRDAFTDGDEIITLPVCRHIHHSECITRLFTSYSSRCPICRHDYGSYIIYHHS